MNKDFKLNKNYTEIISNEEARNKIVEGAKKIRDIVQDTMGAKGLYVAYDDGSSLGTFIHNDGVTVLNNIKLEDKFEEIGAKALREASRKTNIEAGDFTTGTAVIGANLLIAGAKLINEEKIDPLTFNKNNNLLLKYFNEYLNKVSIKKDGIDTIKNIATVSAKSKEIGNIIAEAHGIVGSNGKITLKNNTTTQEHYLERENGYLFKGWIPHNVLGQGNWKVENPKFVIVNEVITRNVPQAWVHGLVNKLVEERNKVINNTKTIVFILAKQWTEEGANTIIQLSMNESLVKLGIELLPLEISEVNNQYLSEVMKDIQILTNTKPHMQANGFSVENGKFDDSIKLFELQSISNDNGMISMQLTETIETNEFKALKVDLEQQIDKLKDEAPSNERKLFVERRYAGLNGAFVTLYIYSSVNSERGQILSRVEDAIRACRSYEKNGYVPGAGSTIRSFIKDDKFIKFEKEVNNKHYIEEIKKILKYNEECIYRNAYNIVNTDELDFGKGFNVNDGDGWVIDLVEENIIDPTYSIMCGMKNAIASTSTLLLTNHLILEVNK